MILDGKLNNAVKFMETEFKRKERRNKEREKAGRFPEKRKRKEAAGKVTEREAEK